MQRVIVINLDGNVIQKEDEGIDYNELVYEMSEEFLKPLQDE